MMTVPSLVTLEMIPDDDLLSRVKKLAQCERVATAVLIAHLAVLDGRRLYIPRGHASLFSFCTRELHFSESAAFNRIKCVRAVRRFPVILNLLAQGLIHLTAVRLLAPYLTSDNHMELLDRATHQSQRQIEALVAELNPQPAVPSQVRKLPQRGTLPMFSASSGSLEVPSTAGAGTAGFGVAPLASPPGSSAQFDGSTPRHPTPTITRAPVTPTSSTVVKPLAPNRYKVQFTASEDTHEKLREAQDLLRHQIPTGDIALVIDRALTDLVLALRRRKFAALKNSRAREVTPCYPCGRPAPCP